jgi:flagellar export protein FliJ
MKRYAFRLDTVLRVRKVEEDRAIAALADATRALQAAEQTLRARLDRYGDVPAPTGALPVADLLKLRARQDGVAAAVVYAGAQRLRAEATVDVQRDEWSAAAMRVAALERLDERRRGEHAAEAERQEAIEVDDMVVARAGRRS